MLTVRKRTRTLGHYHTEPDPARGSLRICDGGCKIHPEVALATPGGRLCHSSETALPLRRAWRMGNEVVVFLKVFFQDYCRLLGLPR